MGLWSYVKDSDVSQVIDSNGYNVIANVTSVSYTGNIAVELKPVGTYYSPKFSYLPDATLVQAIRYNTLVTNTTYGKERRRNKWEKPRRSWVLNYSNASGTSVSGIATYYNLHQNLNSFEWVNPVDSTSYKVRFVENSLKREYVGNDRYNIQLGLIELI